MSQEHKVIGPMEMGKQLVEALGLQGVKGILKLQITAEAGELPKLTIVRTMTHEQAGAVCVRLLEWQCELVPQGDPKESEVKAAGEVVAAPVPYYAGSGPKDVPLARTGAAAIDVPPSASDSAPAPCDRCTKCSYLERADQLQACSGLCAKASSARCPDSSAAARSPSRPLAASGPAGLHRCGE